MQYIKQKPGPDASRKEEHYVLPNGTRHCIRLMAKTQALSCADACSKKSRLRRSYKTMTIYKNKMAFHRTT
ncbi:hypothetical protein CHS0354_010675 [Potamilus streckersoni]|uniref:Uncharacterized protein n=1 Tax=Potamilus streckersoni TaxID=2493646 RepID=A0AAE0TC89_9BIVA|nr:hypothetical protein CHS0354_010675 [Potamilus streckersoni]